MALMKIKQANGQWAIIEDSTAIRYTTQTLSETEQAQARANIDAVSSVDLATEIANISLLETLTDTTITLTMNSHTEYQCSNPIASLTIEGFNSYKEGCSDQWSIVFTAADTISIDYPDTVKWALAEPIFDPNTTYWLSFIPFGGNYLGVWTVIS